MDDSVPLEKLYKGKNIFLDCWQAAADFLSLAPFHFKDRASYGKQAGLLSKGSYERKILSSALIEQNERFGAGPGTLENLRRLSDPRSVVVIGGQQAGLFGGPLYTLYKALTVSALAERAEADLGIPVIPVFWIAAEDHDLAEVNHIHITDMSGKLVEITLGENDGRKIPISKRRFGEGLSGVFSLLSSKLPDILTLPELSSALRHAYSEGASFPDAFGTWMQYVLKDRGMVFVDPSDTRLKRLSAGLFRREIEEKGAVARAVIRQTARMEKLGYPPQIELREGMLTLFHQDPAREAITVTGGGFWLKDASRRFTKEELVSIVENEPEKLSPNAALRPLFQDSIFPTLAVVLGPSELAYYTQLTAAYDDMGIPMPILFPRASLTVTEPKISRLMKRHGLTLVDVIGGGPRIIDRLARREIRPELLSRMAAGRSRVEQIWEGIAAEVEDLDRTLRPTAENAKGRSLLQFDHIEKKIAKAARRKNQVLSEQVDRIHASLFPREGLQERSLNVLPFLARYGEGVLEKVSSRIDIFAEEHRVVEL